MGTILAASQWPTNSHLIADCHRLGYLRDEWVTLDPTFGKGNWWKIYRPTQLITHDIRIDNVDFRELPEPDKTFDAVAFDPPYVSIGGRTTTTIPSMHSAYGMNQTPNTPQALQNVINDGLQEIFRVLKLRGVALIKCQDYITSGKLWPGTHHTLNHALNLGFRLQDRFEHVTHPRPQPPRTDASGNPTPQRHARRNLSTLFVVTKP